MGTMEEDARGMRPPVGEGTARTEVAAANAAMVLNVFILSWVSVGIKG
jgi:hypothetical protein